MALATRLPLSQSSRSLLYNPSRSLLRLRNGINSTLSLRLRLLSTSTVTGSHAIDPSRLIINKTSKPKPVPPASALTFGTTFTDHMLMIPWSEAGGWEAPRIEPYGPVALDPSASVFQYATTLFEGMKAFKDKNGKVTLFRPDMNMKRMVRSAARIALPTFDEAVVLELIRKLIELDKHWVPQEPGTSLYIRPNLLGTNANLGVAPPNEALLWVICCPVGSYYASEFKPVALEGTTHYTRAYPGGTGSFKLGMNYAPAVVPQKEAYTKGYVQNLWLHGPEHYLTEVGTMNMFVTFKLPDGSLELVTPPLDGLILPGITRDSVVSLMKDHLSGHITLSGLKDQKVTLSERQVTMNEVIKAQEEGRLVEMFGTGTAAVISPVEKIGYLGRDIPVPTGPGGMGPIAKVMWDEITARQTGAIQSEWSYVVCEN